MFRYLRETRSGTAAWFTAIVVTAILATPFLTYLGALCLDHYSNTRSTKEIENSDDSPYDPKASPPPSPYVSDPRSRPPETPAEVSPTPTATATATATTQPITPQRMDPYSQTDQSRGPWYRNAESRQYRMFTRFAVLSAVAAFGALGAALSMALRYRQPGISQPTPTPLDVISTQLLGASFALLLCLLFLGKFIRGTLFPDPQNRQLNQWFAVVYSLEEFAKLLVWSFIAGFSERLVPDFIRSLSERFTRETANKDDPDGI